MFKDNDDSDDRGVEFHFIYFILFNLRNGQSF